MADGSSLVNLGEISKPATVLIEKISDALGGAFRPFQIRRVAKAEADAKMIEAVAQVEISELQKRALQRFVVEEGRRQDNIEAITAKALPGVRDTADPSKIDDDWITNFFDKCRLISNDEMQVLWAQILSGEANTPGKYSKRTVDYLASLDKSDALLFRALCGFGWYIGQVSPLVFDTEHELYKTAGIGFTELTHLDNIGLIRFESIAGFRVNKLGKRVRLAYYGAVVELEFASEIDNS